MFTIHRPIKFRKSSRHLFVSLTILTMTSLPQLGFAAEVSWTNDANSFWSFFPSNWSNGTLDGPTAADDVVFDRGVTHSVSFNISPTNKRLLVRNDDVTFLPNGFTYTLTDIISGSVVVGQSAGQVGQLSLLGPGTLSAKGLSIGVNNSTGTLNINGSTVTSNNSRIGTAGGTGTVNVSGFNSSWTTSIVDLGSSSISEAGNGTLNIEAGGEVNVDRLIYSTLTTSTSNITVTGFNSKLLLFDTFNGGGTATIRVENGGEISSFQSSIYSLGANSTTATVTGTNSKWTNTDFFIGGDNIQARGTGILNLADQGTLEATGQTKIWAPGTLNLDGGTLTTGSLQILGAFNFTQGTLNLTGSSMTVGAGGLLGSTLILNPGMAVNVTNGLGDVAAGGKLLINDATSSFLANGGTNNGQITAVNSSLTYTGAMTNNTKITSVDAALSFAGDGLPTSGGGDNADGLTNLGTLNLTNTVVNGDLHSPAGSTINGAGAVVFNGLVSGGANITGTTTTFNGGYSPGDSAAEVMISGDVTLGSTNTLFVELAGTTLGTEFDHLNIGGLLTVDGALDIRLLDSFAPQLGDTFDLLDFGSLVGSFSDILLPTLADGLIFDTTSLLADGVISVVAGTLGDFDFDGDVDGDDFLAWQRDFGSPYDSDDLTAWQTNFGTGVSSLAASQVVPEPSTRVMLALGIVAMVSRPRLASSDKFLSGH